jgi:hypothetical protein
LVAKLQLLGWNIEVDILSLIEARRCAVTDLQIVLISEACAIPIIELFPRVPPSARK